ncbi:MAG: thioredoxin family protein [Pseudonocardia sp.]|nr:thioredoxin family protein [Pseudonocardia sp.]
MPASPLPADGIVAVVKRDCPTCRLVEPVLAGLPDVVVYSQDDPTFPANARDDTALEVSLALGIETVPTLVRFARGAEVARTPGWSRPGVGGADRGPDLPEHRRGCGSRTMAADRAEELLVRRIDGAYHGHVSEPTERPNPQK